MESGGATSQAKGKGDEATTVDIQSESHMLSGSGRRKGAPGEEDGKRESEDSGRREDRGGSGGTNR